MEKPQPEKPLEKSLAGLVARMEESDKKRRALRAQADPNLAFLTSELIQCTLPHSDPGNIETYSRTNNLITLMVDSGKDPVTLKPYGIPYGSIPRLLLYYITTEAVRTRSRRITFGKNLHAFMRKIGLNPDNGSAERSDYRRLIEQANRLFSARITIVTVDPNRDTPPRVDLLVTDAQNLRWTARTATDDNPFDNYIDLSELFFDATISSPVPVYMLALKKLQRSPLALDLYGWATFRMYLVNEKGVPVTIPLAALARQFGAEYKTQKEFNRKFRAALAKVKEAYPELNYTVGEGTLTLCPSPTAIPSKVAA